MKAKKRTFTINRTGYFITSKFTPFQCTVEGWDSYKYELALKGSPEWDAKGFLVDHNLLDQKIKDYIETNDMKSCEIMLEGLCDCIAKKCQNEGVKIKKIKLTLSPVRREDLGLNKQGELRCINPSYMDMPAFGKFICKF